MVGERKREDRAREGRERGGGKEKIYIERELVVNRRERKRDERGREKRERGRGKKGGRQKREKYGREREREREIWKREGESKIVISNNAHDVFNGRNEVQM